MKSRLSAMKMVFEYDPDSTGPCLIAREGDLRADTQKADHDIVGRRQLRSGWRSGPISFTSLRSSPAALEKTRQQSGRDESCIWSEWRIGGFCRSSW